MESLGGGAHFLANATLTNCTFYNNMANQNGGALSTTGKTFNLRNSILIENTTDEATGSEVYLFGLGSIVSVIDRNIISSGMAGVTMGMSMVIAPSTSIQDRTAAEVFESVTPDNVNFLRLKDGSTAVNAGLNAYVPTGIVTDAGATPVSSTTSWILVPMSLISRRIPRPSASRLLPRGSWAMK